MKNIESFVEKNKIKMDYVLVDNNPHVDSNFNWEANHYKVTLKKDNKQFTVYFSQGIRITKDPTPEGVLDCLANEVAGYENSKNFEEWASGYGYDLDSRKAEKIYKAIAKQSKKLKKFLGDVLYNELLWEIERL